jgi:hypothetical protein
MVFTTRSAGGRGGKNAFEKELRRLHVTQKNSTPNHPQTCGKVERLHQTQKKWLTAQPDQPATIDELQALLDPFRDEYNHRRPHRGLNRTTPATAYAARPKATPTGARTDSHDRTRRDTIDESGVVTLRHNGRLHHIGTGRTQGLPTPDPPKAVSPNPHPWVRAMPMSCDITLSGRQDLNLRPLDPQSSALPSCATSRLGPSRGRNRAYRTPAARPRR